MTNIALEVETKQISNYAAYDASIEVDWTIPFTDKIEKRKIGFIGFYCSYDENEKIFRTRVFKAYDAIMKTYENWPDGEIRMSLNFHNDDINMI